MVDHISDTQMEGFCARTLLDSDMAATARHIAVCRDCRQHFQNALRKDTDGVRAPAFSLSPVDWFRNEHLDEEQLDGLVEDRLDREDREIATLHLETCAECREEVRSLRAFLQSEEFARSMQYSSKEKHKWLVAGWKLPRREWKLGYATATLAIVTIAILAALYFSDRKGTDPRDRIAETPSPVIPASPSPVNVKEDKLAVLRDGERVLRFNQAEVVSGLDTFPSEMQQTIAESLLSGKLKKTTTVSELTSAQGALKGETETTIAVKLLSPARAVLTTDRPVFRWTTVADASGYRIEVGDLAGNEIAKSELLDAGTLQWMPARPFKRGVVYVWTLTAIVNGEEVSFPAPSEAEMRFKVLAKDSMDELVRLKADNPSHLALGLFYLREGMVGEAEREFALLAKQNPDSPIAEKLLRQASSLHRGKQDKND